MTLALALRCADGLVMATDSRATGGPKGAADSSEKFLQVNRDVGIMTYGLAVPGYRAMRRLVEEVRTDTGLFATMDAVSDRGRDVFRDERERFIQEQEPKERDAVRNMALGFILGGFDGNDTGQFRILYGEATNDFELAESPDIIAAQWHLAGALSNYLRFPGMSVAVGVDLAVLLIVLTSVFEESVGGPIRLATVNLERGFTLLHESEIQHLIDASQTRFASMRKAWTSAWCL
jgi:20S proteasome alpha/beta subunit